jgi:hypothetical protein
LFRCIERFLVGRFKGVLTFVLNHPPVFSIFVSFDLPEPRTSVACRQGMLSELRTPVDMCPVVHACASG